MEPREVSRERAGGQPRDRPLQAAAGDANLPSHVLERTPRPKDRKQGRGRVEGRDSLNLVGFGEQDVARAEHFIRALQPCSTARPECDCRTEHVGKLCARLLAANYGPELDVQQTTQAVNS